MTLECKHNTCIVSHHSELQGAMLPLEGIAQLPGVLGGSHCQLHTATKYTSQDCCTTVLYCTVLQTATKYTSQDCCTTVLYFRLPLSTPAKTAVLLYCTSDCH